MNISRQIYTPRRNDNKTLRAVIVTALSFIMLAIVISPAPAAPIRTTTLADLDRGALALIVVFGTLLLAIIFEVWRLAQHNDGPTSNHHTSGFKHQNHN